MLRARKHRKVSMTKVSKREPEAEFYQHPSASRVANQVPCEPKSSPPRRMWRPKQKTLAEASGVATPKPRLSREEKGKMPVCSNHKITTAIIPSSNLRAATPRVGLVLMSEATVPQRTRRVRDGEARTKALFSANPICRDKRSRTSPYVRSKRAFALDCRDPTGSDLRKSLTDRQTSSPYCQHRGCQLLTLHSVHCRLGQSPPRLQDDGQFLIDYRYKPR